MKKPKFYSLIPAKLNSFRLKKKNLLKINNKSLLHLSIEQSLGSKLIQKTIVSTNSKTIIDHCKNYKIRILKRLKRYSSNLAPSSYVIKDFISQMKITDPSNTFIVYLQPTSPLRSSKQIDQAIKKIVNSKKKNLISFKNGNPSILKYFYIRNKKIVPIYKKGVVKNTQTLPKVIIPNGAIFIFNIKNFLKYKQVPFSNFIPFMMNEVSSIDIDTYSDLILARKKFK